MSKILVYGNEPYLIHQYKKDITSSVLMPEFNLLISPEFGEAEQEFLMQSPFLTDKKVLILNMDKLRPNQQLERSLKQQRSQADIYIFAGEVDRRLTLFKAFLPKEIKEYKKLARDVLERFILTRLKGRGCCIRKPAYDLLMERLNYDMDEVTLFDVVHALDRLCAVEGEITLEFVQNTVHINEKENVFELINLISAGNNTELFHQANLIMQNDKVNAIGTLSLLLRSYRLAYKVACGYKLQELGVNPRTYIPKLSREEADRSMETIQHYVNGIKTGMYTQEIAVKLCFSKLCIRKNDKS